MGIVERLREAAEIQKLLPTLDFTAEEKLADIGRLLTTDAPPIEALADLVEALCWFFECHDAYYWQRREASRVGLYELELLYGEAKNELRNALSALGDSNG